MKKRNIFLCVLFIIFINFTSQSAECNYSITDIVILSNIQVSDFAFDDNTYTESELQNESNPPIWQSFWFLALLVAVIALLVYLFYRNRINKVKRMRIFLEKQVSERTSVLESKNEEIRTQKEMLLEQRDLANKQNAQIGIQKEELEKQSALLEEVIGKRTSELALAKEKIESALKEKLIADTKLDLLMHSSKEMIFSLKFPEEIFDFITPYSVELTGYFEHEFMSDSLLFKKLFSADFKDLYTNIRKSLLKGVDPNECEFLLQRRNGELVWVTFIAKVLNDETDKVKALQGVIRDISEIKKRENNLISAQNRAQEGDRLRQVIEVNEDTTPSLKTISGLADIISDPYTSFNDKDVYTNNMPDSSNSILHFVDDIIDISKIHAGQLEITKSQCYINEILREVESSYNKSKVNSPKKNVVFVFKPGVDEENFSIYTDAYRFRQIVVNLVGCLVKFIEDKGIIEFGYNNASEIISDADDQDIIQFYITCSDVVLTEKFKNELLDNLGDFKEKDPSRNLQSGLGIAISKKLVALLGGDLSFESDKETGTTIKFSLPLDKQKGMKLQENKSELTITMDWSEKTILVAEDEENNYKFIKAALKKSNAKILWAKDGEEAITVVQQNLKQIDLILMDIQMPKMNGYDATKIVKEIDPSIPIVAQTAFAMSGSKIKCFESGCDSYIAKPYKAKDLVEVISKYL
ncbi:MAG: response regulator [Bacteroidales bacterium]|nr:response regulator [Bacteroidales bacterium]